MLIRPFNPFEIVLFQLKMYKNNYGKGAGVVKVVKVLALYTTNLAPQIAPEPVRVIIEYKAMISTEHSLMWLQT